MNPDLIPRHVVNAALRANLPFFAIACIVLIGGVCSLALARLRSRDRLLLWTGVFSTLYGTRLFVQNELVRDAFNSPGNEYIPWILCITYVINIPFALFARELLGRGWKGSIVIWLWLSVAFAMIAIPTAFFPYNVYWVSPINSLLVICGAVLMLLHVLVEGRAGNLLAASLLWPLLIFSVFVLLENNGVRVGGRSVEPIGFLILLGALASIAARRALATERKLIDVKQELATARRIQSSIIPQSPPSANGIRIAARYQPMTSVAGDFYDFLTFSDDVLTILVADVSGHGVPAALVACMLKVCFAAQKNNAADPAAILSGLSVMLHGSLGGQYVTAACAAIDRKTRTVTYAGAGHPPTLLARGETGDLVLLAENGLFIGPFPKATYANISVPFHAGDRLLLYTDGITEANDPTGEEFGQERLGQFLLRSSESEPAAILDRLFDQITSGSQQDDLTAVLVHLV
ncbi:MAG: PP2C family protein-serine/threonine phosphatase [Bryobacteraceae bacterium]